MIAPASVSEEVARARTAVGEVLLLRRRATEFEIRIDGRELMASRAHASEEPMARLAETVQNLGGE